MEEFRARRALYDDLIAPGWLSHLSMPGWWCRSVRSVPSSDSSSCTRPG